MSYLPIKANETELPVDIVMVMPEAYVDHPSFGHAIVSRLLESYGLSVGMISLPMTDKDYCEFGEPRYGFFVSGGVVDSMVNNYTVAKKKRTKDVYAEGGVYGKRPDRCVDVYCKNLKRLFPDSPIVIGGIEASLRRFAHYDYWSDSVLPSIMATSGADLLIYGMGEVPIKEIAGLLKRGVPLKSIRDVRGTCYLESYDKLSDRIKNDLTSRNAIFCPSYDDVKKDKLQYVKAFNIQSENSDYIRGKTLLQKQGDKYLVENPPQRPCTEEELDYVYALPFMRNYHPSYTNGVPALEEVKFSITSHRGCFGGCNYCALTYHQGRIIQKRSKTSIVDEAKTLVKDSEFKGYIHDVGGPTANFRNPACDTQEKNGVCAKKQCIGYRSCTNLKVDHSEYLDILRELRSIERVKKVFIRSGIRFDYLMMDKDETFINELVKHHISGQLKVAPEHVVDDVLKAMNKPNFDVYKRFKLKYDSLNAKYGKKQFLVPYLISSHPASTLKDAVKVAEYLNSIGYMPEQVQDFYPTPSTKSTCMYYTGINPDTMEQIYVPRDNHEKRLQRALLQYRKKENYYLVKEALELAGREDLIGFDKKCLIKPMDEIKRVNGSTKASEEISDKGKFSANKSDGEYKKSKHGGVDKFKSSGGHKANNKFNTNNNKSSFVNKTNGVKKKNDKKMR